MDKHKDISACAASGADIALGAPSEVLTFCHSSGDLDFHFFNLVLTTITTTFGATILDDLAFAATGRAFGDRLHLTKEALSHCSHLASSFALGTGFCLTVFAAGALAFVTRVFDCNLDLLGGAQSDLFQV